MEAQFLIERACPLDPVHVPGEFEYDDGPYCVWVQLPGSEDSAPGLRCHGKYFVILTERGAARESGEKLPVYSVEVGCTAVVCEHMGHLIE